MWHTIFLALKKLDRPLMVWGVPMKAACASCCLSAPVPSLWSHPVITSSLLLLPWTLGFAHSCERTHVKIQNHFLRLKIGFSAWKSGRVEIETSKWQLAGKFLNLPHLPSRNSARGHQLALLACTSNKDGCCLGLSIQPSFQTNLFKTRQYLVISRVTKTGWKQI